MTPNDIEVLLHCHCTCRVHPRRNAPAVQSALVMLVECGLIDPDGDEAYYRTTSRGAAHIAQLCDLGLPTQVWQDAAGKEIK